MAELRRVVRRPLITEKSVGSTANAQYAFEVDRRANKQNIKEAVQRLFKVTVLRVNTVNLPSKTGRNMRRPTRKPVELRGPWKKAIVTLKQGDKIELGGVNYFES